MLIFLLALTTVRCSLLALQFYKSQIYSAFLKHYCLCSAHPRSLFCPYVFPCIRTYLSCFQLVKVKFLDLQFSDRVTQLSHLLTIKFLEVLIYSIRKTDNIFELDRISARNILIKTETLATSGCNLTA